MRSLRGHERLGSHHRLDGRTAHHDGQLGHVPRSPVRPAVLRIRLAQRYGHGAAHREPRQGQDRPRKDGRQRGLDVRRALPQGAVSPARPDENGRLALGQGGTGLGLRGRADGLRRRSRPRTDGLARRRLPSLRHTLAQRAAACEGRGGGRLLPTLGADHRLGVQIFATHFPTQSSPTHEQGIQKHLQVARHRRTALLGRMRAALGRAGRHRGVRPASRQRHDCPALPAPQTGGGRKQGFGRSKQKPRSQTGLAPCRRHHLRS